MNFTNFSSSWNVFYQLKKNSSNWFGKKNENENGFTKYYVHTKNSIFSSFSLSSILTFFRHHMISRKKSFQIFFFSSNNFLNLPLWHVWPPHGSTKSLTSPGSSSLRPHLNHPKAFVLSEEILFHTEAIIGWSDTSPRMRSE